MNLSLYWIYTLYRTRKRRRFQECMESSDICGNWIGSYSTWLYRRQDCHGIHFLERWKIISEFAFKIPFHFSPYYLVRFALVLIFHTNSIILYHLCNNARNKRFLIFLHIFMKKIFSSFLLVFLLAISFSSVFADCTYDGKGSVQ